MLFNSGTFLQFFAAFLLLFYLVRPHLAARNLLIVLASYLFYGWWDYRFLSLLFVSSLLDYTVGLGMEGSQNPRTRKWWAGLSVAGNLTILGFFKYYDFFVRSLAEFLDAMGFTFETRTLGIVLPVGISFYTFQSMSYALDLYRGEIKATRNLIHFLAYVSFFPQLIAGPIERAKHLLPQFGETRRITRRMMEEGLWLCVWGLFKKVALADNLAPLVEMVYGHPEPGGPMIVLATVAFGFQIYCDFSGYSDMARGIARLLGFDIMVNFNLPYTAANLREFWRRWHISLSTWLRDYLYISLGGGRRGEGRATVNLMATMLLGGLWHGAAWNFVAWGAWHGLGLVAHRFWTNWTNTRRLDELPRLDEETQSRAWPSRANGRGAADAEAIPGQTRPSKMKSRPAPRLKRLASWLGTMVFVFYGWLLFRSGSWHQLVSLTSGLSEFHLPPWAAGYCLSLALFTVPLAAMQWWQCRAGLLAPLTLPVWWRAALQGMLLIGIILFWQKENVPFIYFQF
jgi:alginate O-acetyltransferase complex protein AlgI